MGQFPHNYWGYNYGVVSRLNMAAKTKRTPWLDKLFIAKQLHFDTCHETQTYTCNLARNLEFYVFTHRLLVIYLTHTSVILGNSVSSPDPGSM